MARKNIKCSHNHCEAFESYLNSKKNWNGYYRCLRCREMFFSIVLKRVLDANNSINYKDRKKLVEFGSLY